MAAKITLDTLKNAIKAEVNLDALSFHIEYGDKTPEQITDRIALRDAPLTTHIARRLELPKQTVYAALNRQLGKGNLMKESGPGRICGWWYEGLMDEIRPLLADVKPFVAGA